MIFDGVFHRFPGLRVAVVELGASWIVSWMKHLDQAFRAFRRLQDLSQVKMQPSEYVQKHIKVTPFAGEDIGWLLSTHARICCCSPRIIRIMKAPTIRLRGSKKPWTG